MKYTEVDGVSLSRLGMGNMRLPVEGGKLTGHIDEKTATAMVDFALASGVNYFDTAYIYHKGASESFLGEALSRYPRDSYHLATKFFIGANPNYRAVFERQLSKLKTDYIDFYLIHSVFDITSKAYRSSGAIEYFLEQKERGRIGHLGFSSHMSPGMLRGFCKHHDWDFVQLQLNYDDWLFGTAHEQYDIACSFGLPIIVMEPVKGGRLADLGKKANEQLREREPERSIASWGMRWLLRLPQVKVVLSGMSTLEQMRDNVSTFSEAQPLSSADALLLENVCRSTHNRSVLPCTSCRYCCDSCPERIDIPRMLALYNKMKTDGKRAMRTAARADDLTDIPATCIACGACTRHCPQSIDVPHALHKLASALR